jgi:hypothetical protein
MQKVSDNRRTPQAVRAQALARASEHLSTLLGALDRLPGPAVRDRAHAGRLRAIEEAARLVAEAAVSAPSSLRGEPLRAFSALVMRLAVECESPAGGTGTLDWNGDLAALEERHGPLSATLMGVSLAVSNMQAAIGGPREPSRGGIEGVVRVPLPEAKAWARSVVDAVNRLERDVLLREVDPALKRDAWSLACLVSIALAHVSDHACVDARAALERVAESGHALYRAVALRASQSAGGLDADDAVERSCMALVEVVEDGVRILTEALGRRDADAAVLAWRLIARGRTGLGPDAIVRIAVGAGGERGGSLAMAEHGAALAKAAASYEAEWAA